MSLFKLLLIGAAIWIALRYLRRAGEAAPPRAKGDDYIVMARCAQCGVHLPSSSLTADGRCGKCSDG
ncbi:MAG TPA: hypothetical protein VHE37_12620 [Nevskiaceae bacterium]|nr:hypothetical protein [Nevskiaceae bacterium]